MKIKIMKYKNKIMIMKIKSRSRSTKQDNKNKKQRNFAFDNEEVANNSIDYRFLIDISNPVEIMIPSPLSFLAVFSN